MVRLSERWTSTGPLSACLAKDVFIGEMLVARIVDITTDIYLSRAPSVQIFRADLLFNQVWEFGNDRFSDEASALRSIESRLKPGQ